MLIEENYMASKRPLSDIDRSIDSTRKKINSADLGTTRSGGAYLNPVLPKAPSNKASKNAMDIDALPNNTVNDVDSSVVIQSPEHPTMPSSLPKPKKSVEAELQHQQNVSNVVNKLVNLSVHTLSLAEISAISSVARAKVKSAITKPQSNNNRINTNNTNLLVQPDLADVSSLVLNESLIVPTKT
jgi:hypothetical protein